jgi:hypothetical protein
MVDGFVFGFCLDWIASWASWAFVTFDFFRSMDRRMHYLFVRSWTWSEVLLIVWDLGSR